MQLKYPQFSFFIEEFSFSKTVCSIVLFCDTMYCMGKATHFYPELDYI